MERPPSGGTEHPASGEETRKEELSPEARQEQPQGAGTAAGSQREPHGAAAAAHTGDNGELRGHSAVTPAHLRAHMTRGRRGFSPASGPETALKALVSFNFGCAATSSGGRAQISRGKRGKTQFPESAAAGLNNDIPQCPLRSDLPLPGAARIPCRSFPAHSPCHPGRGQSSRLALTPAVPGLIAHTIAALAQFKSRSPQLRAVPGVPGPQCHPGRAAELRLPPGQPRHGPGPGQRAEAAQLNWQLTKGRFVSPFPEFFFLVPENLNSQLE